MLNSSVVRGGHITWQDASTICMGQRHQTLLLGGKAETGTQEVAREVCNKRRYTACGSLLCHFVDHGNVIMADCMAATYPIRSRKLSVP